MVTQNKMALEYCGVLYWHDKGYTGKHGLTATGERFNIKDWGDLGGIVSAPFFDKYSSGLDEFHAYETAFIHREFAPERKIVQLPYSLKDFESISLPYISKHSIDLLFLSVVTNTSGRGYDSLLEQCPHFTFIAAAGNDGTTDYNHLLDAEHIYGAAGATLGGSNTIIPAIYSSASNFVDFCFFTGLSVQHPAGKLYQFTGTSCATPALVGLCACVNDLFVQKTGKPLARKMMYQFLKDCSVDINTEGFDTKAGWGLPVLPRPEDVDIQKYAGGDQMAFTDTENHWAKEFIDEAAEDGIVSGFMDGTFRPDEPATRAQICKIYCLAKRLLKGE